MTLYEIIVKNIIHGPRSLENPLSLCTKDRKCSKKCPLKLIKEAAHNDNECLLYYRRAPADGG